MQEAEPGSGAVGLNAERRGRPLLVGDVMATSLIVVGVDAGLGEAAALLERHAVSGLPVLDPAGALVGVVSESDLLRARATDYLWAQWQSLRVRHLMTAPALTIRPDEPLSTAARRMERHHVSRLVVVDGDNEAHAVGVVAISDLLRAMADGTGAVEEPPAPVAVEPAEPVADIDPEAPEERGD